MKRSESQNLEREESHRYSTASVTEEYLYAAPTKYVNAGKTSNLVTPKTLEVFYCCMDKIILLTKPRTHRVHECCTQITTAKGNILVCSGLS